MKHTMKHTIFHPAHVLLFFVFLLSKAIANKTISAVSLALYLSLALASCGSGGGGGGSSQSSGASEKLSAALAAPSGLTATVKSATEITLSWSATTNATFYEVYRGTSSNSADSTKKSDTTLTTTSYASTGLTANTDYYYWLKACNSSGCSGFSTTVNKTTPRTEFITTWKVKAGETITIPTNPDASLVYKYNVDCNDDGTDEFKDKTGDVTCRYIDAGTYTVAISGDFPAIFFNGFPGDWNKIYTVENWGTISWKTMIKAFAGAAYLTQNATDVPDLSGVSSIAGMFLDAYKFNYDISGWDVSNVSDMRSVFNLSSISSNSFNQDISGWNVSKVEQCTFIFTNSTMSRENLDKIKSTTDGWLRHQADGGLPEGSACRTTISGL